VKLLPVKTSLAGLFLASALCWAGCSVADSVRERVAADNAPHIRIFAAEPRAAYAAAHAALDPMGFRLTHGGPAEGQMDALSSVMAGEAGEKARQVSLHAEFHAADGGTEVKVWLKEIIEDDSARLGMATTTPMRDTPLYEVFFHAIQANLTAPPR
jgi:hypothetical protein